MDSRLAIDIGVLVLYFVIIIFIGLRMGRKEDNLEDFALGGRRIPWWAVLASLIAAETSAGTFFGTPGEGFSHRDYTYLQLAFGTIIGRILVIHIIKLVRCIVSLDKAQEITLLDLAFGNRILDIRALEHADACIKVLDDEYLGRHGFILVLA